MRVLTYSLMNLMKMIRTMAIKTSEKTMKKALAMKLELKLHSMKFYMEMVSKTTRKMKQRRVDCMPEMLMPIGSNDL